LPELPNTSICIFTNQAGVASEDTRENARENKREVVLETMDYKSFNPKGLGYDRQTKQQKVGKDDRVRRTFIQRRPAPATAV